MDIEGKSILYNCRKSWKEDFLKPSYLYCDDFLISHVDMLYLLFFLFWNPTLCVIWPALLYTQSYSHVTNKLSVSFFFLQTFNTIKKLRESSSTSPVAETEGSIMEEVKASCNSYLIWNRSGLWLSKDCISNCSCKPKMENVSYFWNSVSQLIDQTHCFWKIYWENPWTIFLCFIYCSLQIICKFIP